MKSIRTGLKIKIKIISKSVLENHTNIYCTQAYIEKKDIYKNLDL